MVYIGLSARILLNIEALNMTESVGNFVKHRRAPVVLPSRNGYVLKYVPVISGETLAHAYQEILAMIAVEKKLPICSLCRRGVFIKHSDSKIFKRSGIPAPKSLKDPVAVEKTIVEGCIVEDIGGFLYTDAALKRTSRFMVGYMMPAIDTIKASAAEAQFHVRYDPMGAEAQSIYNVEAGSAIYVFNFALDLEGIGYSSLPREDNKPAEIIGYYERVKRVEAALKSLVLMLTQQLFGAKRTRFMPHWRIMSLATVIADPLPLNPIPGHHRQYIVETLDALRNAIQTLNSGKLGLGEKATLIYYNGEELPEPTEESIENIEVEKTPTPYNALSKLAVKALDLYKSRHAR